MEGHANVIEVLRGHADLDKALPVQPRHAFPFPLFAPPPPVYGRGLGGVRFENSMNATKVGGDSSTKELVMRNVRGRSPEAEGVLRSTPHTLRIERP